MKRLELWLIGVMLCLAGELFAADVNWNIRREGADIEPGMSMTMTDGNFADLLGSNMVDVSSFSYVRLGFIDGTHVNLTDNNYLFRAKLQITPYNNLGSAMSSTTQTLEIERQLDGMSGSVNTLVNLSDYRLSGIHKIKVKVVDLYRVDPNTMVQTSIASFPNYIYLEA